MLRGPHSCQALWQPAAGCYHLVQVNKCLSIKGAEDVLNKPHAFEITTVDTNFFFIADSDKVRFSKSLGQAKQPATQLAHTGEGGLDQCSRQGHSAAFKEVCLGAVYAGSSKIEAVLTICYAMQHARQ